MKVLQSRVISAVKSGNYQYAKIESLKNGRATVRMGKNGNGARMTNLSVVGPAEEGGLAVIDYSTGNPYVKSVQYYTLEEAPIEEAPAPLELSPSPCDW